MLCEPQNLRRGPRVQPRGKASGIYRIRLKPGQTVTHKLGPGRGAWLQIAEGVLSFNGIKLTTGDEASTEEPGTLTLSATTATEAILFDLK